MRKGGPREEAQHGRPIPGGDLEDGVPRVAGHDEHVDPHVEAVREGGAHAAARVLDRCPLQGRKGQEKGEEKLNKAHVPGLCNAEVNDAARSGGTLANTSPCAPSLPFTGEDDEVTSNTRATSIPPSPTTHGGRAGNGVGADLLGGALAPELSVIAALVTKMQVCHGGPAAKAHHAVLAGTTRHKGRGVVRHEGRGQVRATWDRKRAEILRGEVACRPHLGDAADEYDSQVEGEAALGSLGQPLFYNDLCQAQMRGRRHDHGC